MCCVGSPLALFVSPVAAPLSQVERLRHASRFALSTSRRQLARIGSSSMASPVGSSASVRKRNPILRGLLFVLGLICLALIPLSYLPGIPTFDLVLLAAFFFSMSSERMHSWMVNHRYFGKIINGYREHGLTMRMKWTAAVAIFISIGVSAVFLTDNSIIRTLLAAVLVYAVWFVFTRPTRVLEATT